MSQFVTPNQKRYIDPYSNIIEGNQVNTQVFDSLANENYIAKGLKLVAVDEQHFKITEGICVIDKVAIQIPEQTFTLSDFSNFQTGTTNYVVVKYQYQLKLPVNRAFLDIVPTISDVTKLVILGFVDITNTGSIQNLTMSGSYNGYSRSVMHLDHMFSFITNLPALQFFYDINMNNKRISNLVTQEAQDAATKEYVDQHNTEGYTRVVNGDQLDYLTNKVEGTSGISIQDDNHKLRVSKDLTNYNKRVKITSADSGGSRI